MRRANIFWGSILILLGLIFLMGTFGILPKGINVWQLFWPVLIIILGVLLLFPRFFHKIGNLEREKLTIPLEGAQGSKIRIKHAAGRLELGETNDVSQLLIGSFLGGVDHSLDISNGQARLKLKTPSFTFSVPPFVHFEGLNWDVDLNPEVPLNLYIETGASEARLDLTNLKVSDLELEVGASSTEVYLPKNAGLTRMKAQVGAGSLKVTIPAGVAARISTESSLASIHIDTSRFLNRGGYYESADYATAGNRVEIRIKADVGSADIY